MKQTSLLISFFLLVIGASLATNIVADDGVPASNSQSKSVESQQFVGIPVDTKTWHTLTLSMQNDKITASINGKVLCEVTDNSFKHGMAGIGSSFHNVDFDNFGVLPIDK
ncbi:hypothetical protein FACS1894189_5450 [Planctomycetales bacterium]|nr:hypothetical protein FACS1894189_5450 [Planctomycetales bacterium]